MLPTVGGKHFFENVSDAKQSLPKRQFSARVAKNTIFRTLQGEGSARGGPGSIGGCEPWGGFRRGKENSSKKKKKKEKSVECGSHPRV